MKMIVALVSLAVQAAVPASAATPTPAAPERKVCRSEATTGSMMPAKRVCHTASEWKAIGAASSRGVDTFRNRPQGGLAPGGGIN